MRRDSRVGLRRSTRNRVGGVEPPHGFESHSFRNLIETKEDLPIRAKLRNEIITLYLTMLCDNDPGGRSSRFCLWILMKNRKKNRENRPLGSLAVLLIASVGLTGRAQTGDDLLNWLYQQIYELRRR